MTAEDVALIAALPGLAFQAVLVFARLGAAVMLLPGLGEQEIPATIRLGIGIGLLAAVLPVLLPALPPQPATEAEALRLVGQEVVVGLWLGSLARILALALAMAGQAIAALIGLQGLLASDPALGGQATALGRAFGLVSAVLVLGSGLYAVALRALVESYTLVPAGAVLPAGAVAENIATAGAAALSLALRLAAPFVIGAVVLNLGLALLARLTPQVQTFFVAIPGQILAGIALLMLLARPLLDTYAEALDAGFQVLPGGR